jgi:hypothetical protein
MALAPITNIHSTLGENKMRFIGIPSLGDAPVVNYFGNLGLVA